MNYLIIILFIFLFSCSSNKKNDLIDIEDYMKQGNEISLINKFDFKEVNKINKLELLNPRVVNNWLSNSINSMNYFPRFMIGDYKNKNSIDINAKSFLVINKKIYIIDRYSNLILLDENMKELKRNSIYKKKDFDDYVLDFSMTSDGKLIYTSDNLGNIHCINPNNLEVKWSLRLGVPIQSDIYLNNSDLFFINSNNKLYSVKSSNGEINWSLEHASKIFKGKYQLSISNNLLITNNDYGEIYCYDLLKRNLLWKLTLNDQNYQIKSKNFIPSQLVSVDGVLYFSSNFGETLAIEKQIGKILWRKSISTNNSPIINNKYVLLINNNGYFYVLNKNNGDVIYSKNINQFNSKKNKKDNIYYNMILGKDYIYFMNSAENLIKLDINNLNQIKKDNKVLNNSKVFFVINSQLYFIEEKSLSKFYN